MLKSVAVIGLGSIGSKVAESLVRSGVRRLLLVDGDIFLPGNLERHVLDWRDVGYEKVHALKRRFLEIAPNAEIEVIVDNLNWQRSARVHADHVNNIADCDVLVGATGDTAVNLFLGAIAAENRTPFVSAEVYEGGLGAVVARSLPERDPPYAFSRQCYLAYCEQQNVQPPRPGEKQYESILDDGTPVVADDASVSAAAAHCARVVIDVLDHKVAPEDPAWLLFGFRKGWLFQQHGHNIMLDVGPPTVPPEMEDAQHAEIRAFALNLADQAVNASKNSS
ncbi:MAG: HesA/MoeB/ThiF family protein [Candidatus Sumerlaeaceae bacterium]